MKDANVIDSLCLSIEDNPNITDYAIIERKSNINWNDRLMNWTLYVGVQLKDKETEIENYIKNMNDFLNSFKFVHDGKILNPDYTKLFTKTSEHVLMRGEKAYSIRHSPIIDQKIDNWPEAIHTRAMNIMMWDHIHVYTDIIIRPSLSSPHMQPEVYDKLVTLEKHMNTGTL
jgi:hypothetical protein